VRVEGVGDVEVVGDETAQSTTVEIGSWRELTTNCDIRAAASMLVTSILKRLGHSQVCS
jgi:hypothetical protein